ncbi:unnamed protein product [Caenorhabditis brenneri]
MMNKIMNTTCCIPVQKTAIDFPRSSCTRRPQQNDNHRKLKKSESSGQLAMSSEWEGMNKCTTVSRVRPSSTGFPTTNYISMSQYNQKSSNLITEPLVRKPVGFGFRFLGGVKHILLLDKSRLERGEDGRLHGGDENLRTDGNSVKEESQSEAVVFRDQQLRTNVFNW